MPAGLVVFVEKQPVSIKGIARQSATCFAIFVIFGVLIKLF